MNSFLKQAIVAIALLISTSAIFAVKPETWTKRVAEEKKTAEMQNNSTQTSWNSLPVELQTVILQAAAGDEVKQLAKLRLVNKEWKNYIDDTTTGTAILNKIAISKFSPLGWNNEHTFLKQLRGLNTPVARAWVRNVELLNAIISNKPEEVKKLLQEGADPNYIPVHDRWSHRSLLQSAVGHTTNKEVINALLEAGAKINEVIYDNNDYTTALDEANIILEEIKNLWTRPDKEESLKKMQELTAYLISRGAKTAKELGYKK